MRPECRSPLENSPSSYPCKGSPPHKWTVQRSNAANPGPAAQGKFQGQTRRQYLYRHWSLCCLRSSPKNYMSQSFDIAKLVGAASAPVALIIATSIFLSNLTARFTAMFTAARQLTGEFRQDKDKHEPDKRSESLRVQLGLYHRRLRLIMKATFWLTMTIFAFIGTVLFTGISMALPDNPVWAIITAVLMVGGLLLLAACVGIEAWENHLGKNALDTEMAEFPSVQRSEGGSPGNAVLNQAHS